MNCSSTLTSYEEINGEGDGNKLFAGMMNVEVSERGYLSPLPAKRSYTCRHALHSSD